MVEQTEHRARRMWRALEPVHAVTYFAPESRSACEAVGLRGFWRGYFAQRAAPLGAASAALVTALFHSFHPSFVARSVPVVWEAAPPDVLLRVRLEAVDAALRRLLTDEVVSGAAVVEAAEIAREAALAPRSSGAASRPRSRRSTGRTPRTSCSGTPRPCCGSPAATATWRRWWSPGSIRSRPSCCSAPTWG